MAHHNKIPAAGDPMICDDALAISDMFNMSGNPSGMFNRYYEPSMELNADQTLTLGLGYNSQYVDLAAEMLNQVVETLTACRHSQTSTSRLNTTKAQEN